MYNRFHDEFEQRRQAMMQNQYHEALFASKVMRPKNMLEIKINFNDICLREFGLDYDEDSMHVYNIDTMALYQVSEKFIKYVDEEYPIIHANEIELNLIENPRLMEIIFGIWIVDWQSRKDVEVSSYSQCSVKGTKAGYFAMTYIKDGKTLDMKSDVFVNESLRIFNLVTKLNHTTHMYDLSQFDIEILRKDKR